MRDFSELPQEDTPAVLQQSCLEAECSKFLFVWNILQRNHIELA